MFDDADIVIVMPGRCPNHPGVKTSSDDGMFDAPCHICEGEMAEEAEKWDRDPANPRRHYCGNEVWVSAPPYYGASCQDVEDNIPF